MVCMHRSQRTGLLTWLTIRREHVAALCDDRAVAVGDQPGAGVVDADRLGVATPSVSTAGAMCSVWNAPATDSGTQPAPWRAGRP